MSNYQTRRDFLKLLGLGSLVLIPTSKMLMASVSPSYPYGIQLYSLKDILDKDVKGILKQLASFGYNQIESFEGKQGFLWGMKPKEFLDYTTSLGLRTVSAHCNVIAVKPEDFEKKVADAAEAKLEYLICPWIGPHKTADEFKNISDTFNQLGAICKKHGLKFAYHNHDYSFVPVEGQLPMDLMIKHTDPELVNFELDIYWALAVGVDPLAYILQNKNRIKLLHVKDRTKSVSPEIKPQSCVLGKGNIDYKTILSTLKTELKNPYFIVEQESFNNISTIDAAKQNAAYMKTIL